LHLSFSSWLTNVFETWVTSNLYNQITKTFVPLLQNKIKESRKEVSLNNVTIAKAMNSPNSYEIFLSKTFLAFCAHWMMNFGSFISLSFSLFS
jgi:hypothetical protein